ncbi:MAG: VWA domain-containing protein [Hyphomicrobiaceae bacterium]
MTLPQAARPFVDFVRLLRAHGFIVSPDQTQGFIAAVGLLGPKGMIDINRAARAMLAIPYERDVEFDALFRAFFMGQITSAPIEGADDEDDVDAYEPTGDQGADVAADDDESEVGDEAVSVERLGQRRFVERDVSGVLQQFARLAPDALPRRRSYRRTPSRHGKVINMRKTMRDAVRRDGEIFTLSRLRRKTRQRPILLLLDVSGSMSEQSDATMRFAQVLAQAADRLEAFTLGTRLTRITPALRTRQPDQALARVSALVSDFDGGTRLGDALQAFLSVPRFASRARGAFVIIVSDGLERGTPDAMVNAVWRLSRMAWRFDWLTPLASDDDFTPETDALLQVRPYLDRIASSRDIEAICHNVLNLARAA